MPRQDLATASYSGCDGVQQTWVGRRALGANPQVESAYAQFPIGAFLERWCRLGDSNT